jgi:hypothetical protein
MDQVAQALAENMCSNTGICSLPNRHGDQAADASKFTAEDDSYGYETVSR